MKRTLSLLLALCLMLSLFTVISGNTQALSFSDVKSSHWAYKYITYLSEKNVLSGDGNGKFRPDDPVTRSEFIKMIDAAFGLNDTTTVNYTKMPKWAEPYIKAAAAQGYLLNYKKDANFNAKLTREEAVALLIRYLKFEASADADTSSIKDYAKISEQFKPYVLAAVENGIISGYPDGTFKPSRTLTRAEALTVLYRAAGAIYSSSATAAETGCADENASIIANSSLTGLTLKGNVYITEGADLVVLNNCTINGTLYIRGNASVSLFKTHADRIIVYGASTVTLSSGSTVTRIDSYAKTDLVINDGCAVTTFIAYEGGKNSTVTGDGKLTNLGVYVNGVISSIIPEEYYVSKDCTVSIGGRTYEAGSGKPVSTGFTSAEVKSIDASNTISIRFTAQADGTAYAYVWLRGEKAPTVEEILASSLKVECRKELESEIRAAIPYYGFEYNVVLLYAGTNGTAIPLYNSTVISSVYTSMKSTVPEQISPNAPTWTMNFNAGSIILSFDQAIYIKNADSSVVTPIDKTDFLAFAKYSNGQSHTFTENEYVMEVSVENGRHVVYIYPNEGLIEDTEYIVTIANTACSCYGAALSGSTKTAVADDKDAVEIVPVIQPDIDYVTDETAISVIRPSGAAGIRYVYTINGGQESLPITSTGDTSITPKTTSANVIFTVYATALSNVGIAIGKSASASYLVNAAPIISLNGKDYAGGSYSVDLRSSAVVSVSVPSALKGSRYKALLYINDSPNAVESAVIGVGTTVIRALLYDGSTVIGGTVINIGA